MVDREFLKLFRTFGEVRRGRFASAARRARTRRRRLAEIVAWSRRHSPAYAELYAGLPAQVDDPSCLPPVDKSYLMERFDQWVTDPGIHRGMVDSFLARKENLGKPFRPDGTFVSLTSGSSGVCGPFLHDRQTLRLYGALWLGRAYLPWLGPIRLVSSFTRRNWVTVMAETEHYMGVVMSRWAMNACGRADRNTIVPALLPRAELVRRIEDLRPSVLSIYPSTIESLLIQDEGRPRIRPLLVVLSAEALQDHVRELITEAFGASVRTTYAASEFPAIAFECKRGWLHVNDDYVILEPVDADGSPTPPGTVSATVLVTNLVNRIQPVLRYDLADRIMVRPERCECGSRFPAIRVAGRRQELLRFHSATGSVIGISGNAVMEVIESVRGIVQFQAIQTGPRRLRVRLRAKDPGREAEIWDDVRSRLVAYFHSEGLASVMVERDPVPPRADPHSGKFHAAWSEVEKTEGAEDGWGARTRT